MRTLRPKFLSMLLCVLFAAPLFAAPAAALDLTGTWEATKPWKCRIRSAANAGFQESDGNLSTLEINQVGDEIFVLVNAGSGDYEQKFRGPSLTHPKKPEKGYAAATACTVDGAKYYAGTLFFRKASADAEKGKLQVRYYGSRFATVAECKGTYERVSDAAPMVAATCP